MCLYEKFWAFETFSKKERTYHSPSLSHVSCTYSGPVYFLHVCILIISYENADVAVTSKHFLVCIAVIVNKVG